MINDMYHLLNRYKNRNKGFSPNVVIIGVELFNKMRASIKKQTRLTVDCENRPRLFGIRIVIDYKREWCFEYGTIEDAPSDFMEKWLKLERSVG